jgi:hypothetical protein
MSREFIITAISSSNEQFNKSIAQVPIALSVPGVISLHERPFSYDIIVNKKG